MLFCSYYPLISLASTPSTNYELSLALIWLFLFSVLSLKDFAVHLLGLFRAFRSRPSFGSISRLLFYLFPTYLLATAFWSANPLRAALTAGILWCLVITGVTLLFSSLRDAVSPKTLERSFLGATIIFCVICWLQSLLDVVGIERELTLLCPGCTSYSFGFPHPSGLAIEPQFMGNLLLAPTLYVLWKYLNNDIKSPKSQVKNQGNAIKNITLRIKSHKNLFLAFLFTSTLFLTFSRGAIYSFFLGFALLLFVSVFKHKNLASLKSLPLVALSFLFVLSCQGLASAHSPYPRSIACSISASISQLSLGEINIDCRTENAKKRYEIKQEGANISAVSAEEAIAPRPLPQEDSPVFSGYVEESTNARMKFNRIALELAPETPTSLIFGSGLGSAGEIMFEKGKTDTPFEIVQNEYLSLLLETGLLGLAFATLSLGIILSKLKNHPERLLLGAPLLSFAASLLFFSGLPNALHLYLFPVFLALILSRPRSYSSR